MWEKAKEMFPNNKVPTASGRFMTIEELQNSTFEAVSTVLTKPVKTMVENMEKIFYHSDGHCIIVGHLRLDVINIIANFKGNIRIN